jgi:toxin ParE1/3/4
MKELALGWEDGALDDRVAIYEFLVDWNLEAAERTDRLIEEAAESLTSNPSRCPLCVNGVWRKMILTKIPFLIIYSVDEGGVRIMRVFHQSQRIPGTDH